jgi:hypothetical protein
MKQEWARSAFRCLLAVIIDVHLPIVWNAQDNCKKVDRFSAMGAAWARP